VNATRGRAAEAPEPVPGAIHQPTRTNPATHAPTERAADGASQTTAQELGVRRRTEGQHGSDRGTREKIGFHDRSPLEATAHPRPSTEDYDGESPILPGAARLFDLT
jgi:hypothetical protein